MIVAVDPGTSTGIAVLTEDGVLESSLTDSGAHSDLRRILVAFTGADVVCEEAPDPPRHNADAQAPAFELCRSLATRLIWVTPSQWKGHPAAALRSEDKTSSIHERDAVRIGRWYLNQRRHNANEEEGQADQGARAGAPTARGDRRGA